MEIKLSQIKKVISIIFLGIILVLALAIAFEIKNYSNDESDNSISRVIKIECVNFVRYYNDTNLLFTESINLNGSLILTFHYYDKNGTIISYELRFDCE